MGTKQVLKGAGDAAKFTAESVAGATVATVVYAAAMPFAAVYLVYGFGKMVADSAGLSHKMRKEKKEDEEFKKANRRNPWD
jgi:hypothetical protein